MSSPGAGTPSSSPTRLEADTATLRSDGVSVAEGDVVLESPPYTITAPRVEYEDNGARRARATGGVTLRSREIHFEGERMNADLGAGALDLEQVSFRHPPSHGRGSASRVAHRAASSTTVLTDSSFTTCDPDSNAWELAARTLTLDHAAGLGVARNASFRVAGMPVLYTPWIRFPIDGERRTGLLAPSVGGSGRAGSSVTVPFYLNLAPNYDATLRPRLTSRRGPVLGGEFRYLDEHGAGMIETEVVTDDRTTDDARGLISFRDRRELAPGLEARLDYVRASDMDYLEDFGDALDVAATTHLRSAAALDYKTADWGAGAEVETYQVLRGDEAPGESLGPPGDPYRAVPRLWLESHAPERNRRLNFEFEGEFAHFSHGASREVARGARLDVRPALVLPFRAAAGHLVPRVALHYTHYDLDEQGASRALPVVSVDGGLAFERGFTLGEQGFTQTLAPRLHYLFAPHREQDHLPLFDTGSLTFQYEHMFRGNRFGGRDRVGDANRLTLGLESRVLDMGGHERFGVQVGGTRRFAARRVRFCSDADLGWAHFDCPADGAGEEAERSPHTGWSAAMWGRPRAGLTLQGALEHDAGGLARHRRVALDLRYHSARGALFDLGYRRVPVETQAIGEVAETVREMTESVMVAGERRIVGGVRVFGQLSHALEADNNTDVQFGFSYDSCCWSASFGMRRYVTRRGGAQDYDRSLLLQWEFKGLGGSGTNRGRR